MQNILLWRTRILTAGLLLVCLSTPSSAEDGSAEDRSAEDTEYLTSAIERVLWTESRVVGFPDPPTPFQVLQDFTSVDLPKPLSVTALPGTNDLLVTVHKGGYGGPGRLLRLSGEGDHATVSNFLELDEIIYGIAFHPNFASNGFMYVGCNGRSEVLNKVCTRVLRFHVSRTTPLECDAESQTLVIEWPSNGHNGGDLVFGHDGMLYVSAGDGSSDSDANHTGQDLTVIPGSMIRIDVDRPSDDKPYSVPSDNPFLDVEDARQEIWAYGFRNPWRICLDAKTGDLWAGINGQDLWETAQVVRRGENYGWSITEGSRPFQPNRKRGPTPIVPPTIERHHSEARSLTGGPVYYGKRFPSLHGHYIYGDYSTGLIWAAKYREGEVVSHFLVARTSLQISGFGIDHDGELLIVDYGSGLYRLTPNHQKQSTDFPRLLSKTGIFNSVKGHEVNAGLIPYQVNAPLWSDGAKKERFIGLPGKATIGFRARTGWDFPQGTVLVKTFSLPLANQTPEKWTRLETRLLALQKGQWYGYSYEWNDEQTDAMLVEAGGKNRVLRVHHGDAPAAAEQTWRFPSRAECMVCHTRAAEFALGLTTMQMNRKVDHDGVPLKTVPLKTGPLKTVPSQLDHLRSLHVFHSMDDQTSLDDSATFEFPRPSAELPALVDPHDGELPLGHRVRSYLHSNCAVCHVNAGGGNSLIDLAFGTSIEKTKLINEAPLHGSFGIPGAKLVAPRDPARSLLLHRMSHRGQGKMPPLASSVVDQQAVELMTQWIREMDETTGESRDE